MANWTSKIAGIRIDNASGTLTDIGVYINSFDDSGGSSRIDDTGLGDTRERSLAGLAQATSVSINGSLNSTTWLIFAPLVNGTSITKTLELKYQAGKYRTGEVYPSDVRLSTSVGQKSVFSATLSAENGLNVTSVAAV